MKESVFEVILFRIYPRLDQNNSRYFLDIDKSKKFNFLFSGFLGQNIKIKFFCFPFSTSPFNNRQNLHYLYRAKFEQVKLSIYET